MAYIENTRGQEDHSGSEEKPDKVRDARNLTTSRADLATEKAAGNRGRGGRNDSLEMDTNFYQRDVL